MNEPRQAKYEYWPPVLYPLSMATCIWLFYFLRGMEQPLLVCTYVPIVLGAAVITFFELYTPHLRMWIADRRDVWNDALFMVVVQMILPKVLTFLATLALLKILGSTDLQPKELWPHHWPAGIQALLMILVADFFRYWLHRLCHESGTLWKLHAVHHSPKKLYWVNVSRFHPVEKALQFQVDALPFIAVGVGAEVLALYFVLYAVNGFFQHCNVELRMGVLNYVISGPQLHRWHHSRKAVEANSNYGNNIIIWDLVFGTYFYPRDRLVEELGLLNDEYPLDFRSQLKTPLAGNIDSEMLPLQSLKGIAINLLLKFKMRRIGATMYRPLVEASKDPAQVQTATLRSIMTANASTEYGRKHGFAGVTDHSSYMKQVPICEYEELRPFIDRQEKERVPILTSELPLMYNQTSGTTGIPKYIPVLAQTLRDLRRSQQTFAYVQYRAMPSAFYGSMLGLVSPAIDGYLESGTPFGSASGHIYEKMPRFTRAKYVLPNEVFGIENYDTKYYIICRLAVEHDDITYIGSANPSTFHRLLETINSRGDDIMADIESGTCRYLDTLDETTATALRRGLRPNPERARAMRDFFAEGREADFSDFWPYVKLVTTWTGGSCGISLKSILPRFPRDTKAVELGYMSSEVRGTITIDLETNEGIPTIQENFFEFADRDTWEEGERQLIGVADLEIGKDYYLFVTTPAGLYRYNMNDIVGVTGFFERTPTIRFVQKGKGVTNITGEKLHEMQVIAAVAKAESQFSIDVRFYQMLANEELTRYELYLELNSGSDIDPRELAQFVDGQLRQINVEYEAKRAGNRLKPLILSFLRSGTYEEYKKQCLERGQRESQFKGVLLQYARDVDFDVGAHSTA